MKTSYEGCFGVLCNQRPFFFLQPESPIVSEQLADEVKDGSRDSR